MDLSKDWASSLANFPTLAQVKLEQENVTEFLMNAPNTGWHALLPVNGFWHGGFGASSDKEDARRNWGGGLCLIYSQWQCREMIMDWEKKRGAEYDRIVFSRPHFRWIGHHLPLSFLNPEQIWIMDGEDNGGLNDRHWVMPRDAMPAMLGAWVMLVNGRAADMLAGVEVPWLNAELFYAILAMRTGLMGRIRRFPVPAYLLCKPFADSSPAPLHASRSGAPGRRLHVNCTDGGPKYDMEYWFASAVASCKGERDWSWQVLWRCWCSQKIKEGMYYRDYELCARAQERGLEEGWLRERPE